MPTWARWRREQLAHTLLVFDAFHDVAERADQRQSPRPGGHALLGRRRVVHPAPGCACRDPPDRVQGRGGSHHRRPVARAACLVPGRYPAARPVFPGEPDGRRRRRRAGSPNSRGRGGRSPSSATWSAPARRARARSTRCSGTSATTSPTSRTSARAAWCSAAKIAPIFFNTLEDAGALPIECDVAGLTTGDHVVLRPQDGRIETPAGELIAEFTLRSDNVLDEVRAGGRIPLIIGRR